MLNADSILQPCTPEELAIRRQKKIDRFEELWPGVIEKTKEWMKGKYFRMLIKEHGPSSELPRAWPWLSAPPAVRSAIGTSISITSWAAVCDDWLDMITDMADQLWGEAILDES